MIRPPTLALASLLALASPAVAQQCSDRATVVAQLAGRFAEAPTHAGLAPAGMVELWVSSAGSWTLTITLPSGPMCLVASGTAWGPVAVAALPPNL